MYLTYLNTNDVTKPDFQGRLEPIIQFTNVNGIHMIFYEPESNNSYI